MVVFNGVYSILSPIVYSQTNILWTIQFLSINYGCHVSNSFSIICITELWFLKVKMFYVLLLKTS